MIHIWHWSLIELAHDAIDALRRKTCEVCGERTAFPEACVVLNHAGDDGRR